MGTCCSNQKPRYQPSLGSSGVLILHYLSQILTVSWIFVHSKIGHPTLHQIWQPSGWHSPPKCGVFGPKCQLIQLRLLTASEALVGGCNVEVGLQTGLHVVGVQDGIPPQVYKKLIQNTCDVDIFWAGKCGKQVSAAYEICSKTEIAKLSKLGHIFGSCFSNLPRPMYHPTLNMFNLLWSMMEAQTMFVAGTPEKYSLLRRPAWHCPGRPAFPTWCKTSKGCKRCRPVDCSSCYGSFVLQPLHNSVKASKAAN